MPFAEPGSLTDDEVYSLVVYFLHLNDVISEDAVMDRTTLPKVQMPARDRLAVGRPCRSAAGPSCQTERRFGSRCMLCVRWTLAAEEGVCIRGVGAFLPSWPYSRPWR